MKKLLTVLICAVVLIGCKSASDPLFKAKLDYTCRDQGGMFKYSYRVGGEFSGKYVVTCRSGKELPLEEVILDEEYWVKEK